MTRGRAGPLRLVQSLRGEGALVWGRQSSVAVSYSLDVYGQGRLLSGDGDVRGNLVNLVGRSPLNLRLRLEGGHEASISIRDIAPDSASIELTRPVSERFEEEL
jgi:hypothetical protein